MHTDEHIDGWLSSSLQLASIFVSALTGLAVLFGVYSFMESSPIVERLFLSVGLGVVVGTLLGVGWHAVIRTAEEKRHPVVAAVVGFALFLTSFCASSWFLATQIGGVAAENAAKADYLHSLQKAGERVRKNGTIDDERLAALTSAATEVENMAAAEKAIGLVSGISEGRGEWAMSLEAAARSLKVSAAEASVNRERRQSLLESFRKTIVGLQEAITRSDEEAFSKIANNAASILGEADQLTGSGALAGVGVGMMSEQAKGKIEQTFDRLRQLDADADSRRVEANIPYYTQETRQMLVAKYWQSAVGAWIVPGAIDGIPFALLFLLVMRRRRQNVEPLRMAS